MMENKEITEQLLLDTGFEYLEKESKLMIEAYKLDSLIGKEDYKVFRKWIDDYKLKIDIDNGWTNNDGKWHVHVDNDYCETIGCADLTYTWQFNKLMEIFESNFRL